MLKSVDEQLDVVSRDTISPPLNPDAVRSYPTDRLLNHRSEDNFNLSLL